jgi:DNA-binding CsgD family transcriptional regulator
VARMVADLVRRLSYDLEGITARSEFLRAAAESVDILLPSDYLGWTAVDVQAGEAEIYDTDNATQPEIVSALARLADLHPMWTSYRDHANDLAPRRMSDLIARRAWRSHPVYSEIFRPLDVIHQVTVTVAPLLGGSWAGWGFGRSGRDFTDDEMVTATQLQPVLMVLNQMSVRAFRAGGSGAADAAAGRTEAMDRFGLTPREVHILELLATGLTAQAIGHACRISPRTVRKHLENIYAKLGCHDRLMAARRAADLGLVRSGRPLASWPLGPGASSRRPVLLHNSLHGLRAAIWQVRRDSA